MPWRVDGASKTRQISGNVIQLQAKHVRIEDHERETRGQAGRWSQLERTQDNQYREFVMHN